MPAAKPAAKPAVLLSRVQPDEVGDTHQPVKKSEPNAQGDHAAGSMMATFAGRKSMGGDPLDGSLRMLPRESESSQVKSRHACQRGMALGRSVHWMLAPPRTSHHPPERCQRSLP